MKPFGKITRALLTLALAAPWGLMAQTITYSDARSGAGFNLTSADAKGVTIDYAITSFNFEEIDVKGVAMKSIGLQGAFLFNETGAPNLPGFSRNIAIPQGATAKFRIVSMRTEVMQNMEIAPAPRIPKDNERGAMEYRQNSAIYSKNAYYPAEPVQLSAPSTLRGVDFVTLGITPFQYNPVTKQLVIYRDLKVEISFEGGNGTFGDNRLRSPFWDPMLDDALLNHAVLPEIDYSARIQANSDVPGYEYLIICPNGPEFVQWADSIRRFRQQQGITTVVKTLTEVGGNTTTAIESYINNAYATWTPPPAAILLLGDYGTNATNSIISPIYNSYCASDNIYGDVDGNHLPEISMARICAANATQLQVMCSKFLKYERTPPTASAFYAHPISALGWQTERWFQMCSEIVGGFWKYQQGKFPVRINAVYGGNPAVDPWSTATNTSTILSYFGPAGLNYIPSTPQAMPCCWTGGTATQINTAINSGAFCLLHRDHGYEQGWGEPAYSSSNIDGLNNVDLTYVFSINCLTGKYNYSSEVFTEKFHRYTAAGVNSGALGLLAASEVSYSFVNDTYLWGVMDNLWPSFMPAYGTTPASRGVMPCFGNSAGKYFLQQSNWPYNTGNKEVTYNLFHHHGDAFMVVYSEVPQALSVVHNSNIPAGATTFQVSANAGSSICLSLNDEVLAVANGTGAPVTLTIPGTQVTGQYIRVTVTKQNYFRYTSLVQVVPPGGPIPNFSANPTSLCAGGTVDFTDLSSNNPTSWNWSFPGGTPATSSLQHPQDVVYPAQGTYSVSLTVSNGVYTNSTTKTAYISVTPPATTPATPQGDTALCENSWNTTYRIARVAGATTYNWVLTPATAGIPTPLDTAVVIDWTDNFTGTATLKVQAAGNCGTSTFSPGLAINLHPFPAVPNQPSGPAALCQGTTTSEYATDPAANALNYVWQLTPASAGTIAGNGLTATATWNSEFTGTAEVTVKAVNNCNESLWSPARNVTLAANPSVQLGSDTTILVTATLPLDAGNAGASYLWSTGATTQIITAAFTGNPANTYWVDVTSNGCHGSDTITVAFTDPVTLPDDPTALGLTIRPNPSTGVVTLELFTRHETRVTVTVKGVLGTTLLSIPMVNRAGKESHTLDLTSLPDGVYLINIASPSNQTSRKVVIKR